MGFPARAQEHRAEPGHVELRIPHQLPVPEVARRAREASRLLAHRYPSARPRVAWADEQHAVVEVHLLGATLRASVSIEPGEVVVEGHVPFLLRPFAKRARARVVEEMTQWLSTETDRIA